MASINYIPKNDATCRQTRTLAAVADSAESTCPFVQQLLNSVRAAGACADYRHISEVSALGLVGEISVATAHVAHDLSLIHI